MRLLAWFFIALLVAVLAGVFMSVADYPGREDRWNEAPWR